MLIRVDNDTVMYLYVLWVSVR